MPEFRDVSVVIGFKDWGARRLGLAVRSLLDSFGDLDGEVIVSDYGSSSTDDTREMVEALGARYVYTETDGTWSRTRALNAGFAVSTGRVLIATDADMLFSPGAMEVVGRRILADPFAALLLQCRDLPEAWSDAAVEEHGFRWDAFERAARRRPRWGMGGMMAVSRQVFFRLRGYDERMHTYGGEDIDFAWRARRVGARLEWVEDPRVRMYHVWHPSTAARHALSPEESAAVEANKKIMREDKTFVRNVTGWAHRPPDAPPLVSVVIATYNRSALLRDAIHSIQAQTVQDLEIVVVDDGSTDDTQATVLSFDDDRIRYIRQDNAGVAAARNRGLDESRGQYVAVLDDDDIALPWRLEAQFSVLTEGVNATFGAFANFDDATGNIALYRTKEFTDAVTADRGGAPGHSTWMIERSLMTRIRYDETLTSAIDNNFALRSVRSGVVWRHSGQVHTLRRMHDLQITVTDSSRQLAAARATYSYFTFTSQNWTLDKLRKDRGAKDYVSITGGDDEALLPYLPDHLVHRQLSTVAVGVVSDDHLVCEFDDGRVFSSIRFTDMTWADLASFRGRLDLAGLRAQARPSLDESVPPTPLPEPLAQVLPVLRSMAPGEPIGRGGRFEVLAERAPESTSPESTVVRIRDGESSWFWSSTPVQDVEDVLRLVDLLDESDSARVDGEPGFVGALSDRLLLQPASEDHA